MSINQRGSIIPVIALLFGAAVVVTIFGYMMWPKDEETTSNSYLDSNKVLRISNRNTAKNLNSNTNSSTNSNINSSTALPAVKSGWKRFENTKYQYTFDYPASKTIESSEYAVADATVSSNVSFNAVNSGYPAFRVDIITSSNSLRDFANNIWNANKNAKNANYPNRKVGALEEVTLNGQKGYSFTVTDWYKTGTSQSDDSGYALVGTFRYTYLSSKTGVVDVVGYAIDHTDVPEVYQSFRLK